MKNFFKKIILKILTLEASIVLKKHKPIIIGVTGNIGKTTTKDNIAAALTAMNVRENKKSLNSEWGVPLTILDQKSGWNSPLSWIKILFGGVREIFNKNYPKVLILEIGADRKNDIKSVIKWIKFDAGVMTQFAEVPVHIENFKNREEMVREKAFLSKGIKSGGLFIYNASCYDSLEIANSISINKNIKKISFGISNNKINKNIIKNEGSKNIDCLAENIVQDIKNKNVNSQIVYEKEKYNLVCDGVLGESSIMSAMPAIILSKYFNLNLSESISNIKNMERAPGRMRILDGKGESIIIDDSYNSSPLALSHGIKTVKEIKLDNKSGGRKIFILGDMLELGDFTRDEHYKIGKEIFGVADILVTVGGRAKFIAEAARDSGMKDGWILECNNSEEAGNEVLNIIKKGDLVYLKGSQGIRLEKAVKILVDTNIVNTKKDLARQEEEWLSR